MKSRIFIIVLCLPALVFGQKLKWNTEFDFFFDNTEFAKSTVTRDQTMAGATLTQELGWEFDKNHRIVGGVDAMKSLGSHDFVTDFHLLAYYQLENENTLFKAGVFHRHGLFDDYSNLFFQDSIDYYKHTVEGLYLKKGDDTQHMKLWLDWTGLQSETERESFFLGASAFKKFGSVFFADFQSYMYHFATTRPNMPNMSVSDNVLGQVSVGLDFAGRNKHDFFRLSGGLLAGYERDRLKMDEYNTPLGFVIKADAQYKAFGTENIVYLGEKRMSLYPNYGNQLYWGNPFLRAGNYFQNKIYWNVIDTKYITGKLASRVHLSEGNLHFEQLFTLNASINNEKSKPKRPNVLQRPFIERGRTYDAL